LLSFLRLFLDFVIRHYGLSGEIGGLFAYQY